MGLLEMSCFILDGIDFRARVLVTAKSQDRKNCAGVRPEQLEKSTSISERRHCQIHEIAINDDLISNSPHYSLIPIIIKSAIQNVDSQVPSSYCTPFSDLHLKPPSSYFSNGTERSRQSKQSRPHHQSKLSNSGLHGCINYSLELYGKVPPSHYTGSAYHAYFKAI